MWASSSTVRWPFHLWACASPRSPLDPESFMWLILTPSVQVSHSWPTVQSRSPRQGDASQLSVSINGQTGNGACDERARLFKRSGCADWQLERKFDKGLWRTWWHGAALQAASDILVQSSVTTTTLSGAHGCCVLCRLTNDQPTRKRDLLARGWNLQHSRAHQLLYSSRLRSREQCQWHQTHMVDVTCMDCLNHFSFIYILVYIYLST